MKEEPVRKRKKHSSLNPIVSRRRSMPIAYMYTCPYMCLPESSSNVSNEPACVLISVAPVTALCETTRAPRKVEGSLAYMRSGLQVNNAVWIKTPSPMGFFALSRCFVSYVYKTTRINMRDVFLNEASRRLRRYETKKKGSTLGEARWMTLGLWFDQP